MIEKWAKRLRFYLAVDISGRSLIKDSRQDIRNSDFHLISNFFTCAIRKFSNNLEVIYILHLIYIYILIFISRLDKCVRFFFLKIIFLFCLVLIKRIFDFIHCLLESGCFFLKKTIRIRISRLRLESSDDDSPVFRGKRKNGKFSFIFYSSSNCAKSY